MKAKALNIVSEMLCDFDTEDRERIAECIGESFGSFMDQFNKFKQYCHEHGIVPESKHYDHFDVIDKVFEEYVSQFDGGEYIENAVVDYAEKSHGLIVINPIQENHYDFNVQKCKKYLEENGYMVSDKAENHNNHTTTSMFALYLQQYNSHSSLSDREQVFVLAAKLSIAFNNLTNGIDWNDVLISREAIIVEISKLRIAPNTSMTNIEKFILEVLSTRIPNTFELEYQYTIPTTNNLYGGFDNGIVKAYSEKEAREKAKKKINEGFDKINCLLVDNNLPTFNYSLDELEIEIYRN